jgi:Arc/MetJ-type ribon-helix-helix transcriptional regulator
MAMQKTTVYLPDELKAELAKAAAAAGRSEAELIREGVRLAVESAAGAAPGGAAERVGDLLAEPRAFAREGGERRTTTRGRELDRLLADEIWPQVPADVLGKPVSRAEREAILGYGPEGL